MIYTNDMFIERCERHEKSNRVLIIDKIKDIKRFELKRRCKLSSVNYARATMKQRLKMRTEAYNTDLNRWMVKK